ncbi:MAG: UDP-glucose 4-epimerase GalE [Candidatus Marinimicrobia bacterium CG08_land_8_20_14_0_20_45_22]|nr:MAG: UDP-glucose 4-epimerase GalE [Candidatus Marinimicrobia bacterium CG08_land_8_20_14_0_20_45_22]
MKILVTGGAGYIGSHTCLELLNNGYEIIVVDNLINSKSESLRRVQELTGKSLIFHQVDIIDESALETVFKRYSINAVIHFAGLKAVGESVQQPLRYYHNNVNGSLTLFKVMTHNHVKKIVFSSSATIYGDPVTVPITENFPVKTTNPYGSTKLFIENILQDLYKSDPEWDVILLRYFNPVGAHESGRIGEDPNGIPNNLMPIISQVAVGKLPLLNVYGNDYPTLDGTGVRDYIHVVDLARGHIKAIDKLKTKLTSVEIYNLGTGRGYSVFEMIQAFEKASGKSIKFKIVGRRSGDIAQCYADPSKAFRELGWKVEYDIDDMCRSAWEWQMKNPDGYPEMEPYL